MIGYVFNTNKGMWMAKKKRRPGGGRKPSGSIRGKQAVFSTRITRETRQALEHEAAETGQSISQVAEWALRTGLMEKQRNRTARPIRALSFLIERMAFASFRGSYVRTPRKLAQKLAAWKSDPFVFGAFKIAVELLLVYLEPQGPVVSPLRANNPRGIATPPRMTEYEWQVIGRFLETPQAYGEYIFSHLLMELQNEIPSNTRQMLMESPNTRDLASDEYYGLRNARRDLGFEVRRENDQ